MSVGLQRDRNDLSSRCAYLPQERWRSVQAALPQRRSNVSTRPSFIFEGVVPTRERSSSVLVKRHRDHSCERRSHERACLRVNEKVARKCCCSKLCELGVSRRSLHRFRSGAHASRAVLRVTSNRLTTHGGTIVRPCPNKCQGATLVRIALAGGSIELLLLVLARLNSADAWSTDCIRADRRRRRDQ